MKIKSNLLRALLGLFLIPTLCSACTVEISSESCDYVAEKHMYRLAFQAAYTDADIMEGDVAGPDGVSYGWFSIGGTNQGNFTLDDRTPDILPGENTITATAYLGGVACAAETATVYCDPSVFVPMADLKVDGIWREGNYIYYSVINAGSKAASPTLATYKVIQAGGAYQINGQDAIKKLEAQSSVTKKFIDNCRTPTEMITVCADSKEKVAEIDEENNCMTTELQCDMPDLIIKDIWLEKAGLGGGQNGWYNVHYSTVNIGNAPSPYRTFSGMLVEGYNFDSDAVGKLDVLQERQSMFTRRIHCSGTGTPISITVCADYYNNWAWETDETNNCVTKDNLCAN
jgi:hypothetical protein